jgi:hypothetical protein
MKENINMSTLLDFHLNVHLLLYYHLIFDRKKQIKKKKNKSNLPVQVLYEEEPMINSLRLCFVFQIIIHYIQKH